MFCASKVEGSSKVEGVFTITDVYVQLQTLLVFRAILEGGGVPPPNTGDKTGDVEHGMCL